MAKQTFTVGQVLTAAQMTSLQQTAMGGGSTTAKTASYVLVAADAGTVVQMNAAGATTITVNTALFAAGDTVQIQNVGAGVCTVTAGTATVSTAGSLALSQYEGGQLYFNTTSAALFFDIVQSSGMTNPMTTTGDIIYSSSGSTPARLGIGTAGQVLNVASGLPAWATPASGGGMTLLQTMSCTTASTTSSAISGSYNSIYIVLQGGQVTGEQIKMRFNSDTSSLYQTGSGGAANVAATESSMTLSWQNVGSTALNLMEITVPNYANTSYYKIMAANGFSANDGGSFMTNFRLNAWRSTAAITTFTILSSGGGAITATALIYGVK